MFDAISFVKLAIIAIILFLALLAMRNRFRASFIWTWLAIGAVVLIGYSYKSEIGDVKSRVSANLLPGRVYPEDTNIVLTKSSDGHFYINGLVGKKKGKFLIDTGASHVLLKHNFSSPEAGLKYTGHTTKFETAGGVLNAFEVVIPKFTIGNHKDANLSITFNNLRGYIVDERSDFLSYSLIGMNLLEQLNSYKFEDDKLIITSEHKE